MADNEGKAIPAAVVSDVLDKLTAVVLDMREKQEAASAAPSTDERLAQILDALRQNQQPREVRYGDPDYQARLRAEEVVFPRPVLQNGFDANPQGLTPETLARIADIKPGKYLGGIVEVIPARGNGIDFRYDNKSIDQRMSLKDHWRSFGELVAKVHAEGLTRVTVAA